MVEYNTIAYLRFKKYCAAEHSSKLEFLCTKHNLICCQECATAQIDHSENLVSLKSIYTQSLSEYQKLKDLVKIVKMGQISYEELHQYIYQTLDDAFDQLITRIADMKKNWIDKQFKEIIRNLEREIRHSRTMKDRLKRIETEIDQCIKLIRSFTDSGGDIGSSDLVDLKVPEELNEKIKGLSGVNMRKRVQGMSVDINIEPQIINKMLNVKGLKDLYRRANTKNTIYTTDVSKGNRPNNIDSGSLLSKSDFTWIQMQFLPNRINSIRMLYSAKKDGPLAKTFHSKCDNIANTLIIAKGNGRLFGGYAKPPWNSKGEYIRDPLEDCFLFTCRNQTKHYILDYEHAIKGDINFGPTFGSTSADLFIPGNLADKGHTNIGNTYSIPMGSKKEDFMSGTCKSLDVSYEDYEVHHIIFQ